MAAGRWLALGAAWGAAAMAGQPPPTPPATSVSVQAQGTATPATPATPATTPGGGTPDDEFIEFLGADDDAVRWDQTYSAQRRGRPPAVPTQDETT